MCFHAFELAVRASHALHATDEEDRANVETWAR